MLLLVKQAEKGVQLSSRSKLTVLAVTTQAQTAESLEQDDQNDVECDDERVALANLKLDVDENKKIQKQLKKANATLTQTWVKHSNNLLHLRNPSAQDMEILVKTCLMPFALKTQNDSFAFVHELKQEMHADLKYIDSLEDELDDLESDKAAFSNSIICF
ncbi:hypothetical protein Tco_0511365 [Tanacetum coccineum]